MQRPRLAIMTTDHSLPALVDLHNHLVPGVDDGAATLVESLEALRTLYAEGVRTLVATPHLLLPHLTTDAALGRELDRQRRAFETLAQAAEGEAALPALGLGQEIWAPDAATMRRVARRPDVGLGGTATLLVEFGFDLRGTHNEVITAAAEAGRRIVIAHPERYHYPRGLEPLDVMRRWRELGALLQVNAGSFGGYYVDHRPESQQLAWTMVDHALVDLVASDHHGPRRLGVSPLEAWNALAERGARALGGRAMAERPAAILQDGANAPPAASLRTTPVAGA
jgi:protein-tyrosine phosphatase